MTAIRALLRNGLSYIYARMLLYLYIAVTQDLFQYTTSEIFLKWDVITYKHLLITKHSFLHFP
jgi:hypothetical protein